MLSLIHIYNPFVGIPPRVRESKEPEIETLSGWAASHAQPEISIPEATAAQETPEACLLYTSRCV